MYVCLCKGITDKQIKLAIQDGANSMRQLNRCLGVGGQCGKCTRQARDILRESNESSANETICLMAAMA